MTHTAIRHTLSAFAAVALFSAFAGSTPSAGQSSTSGNITGTVRDPQSSTSGSITGTVRDPATQKPKGVTKKGTAPGPRASAKGSGILWGSFHNND